MSDITDQLDTWRAALDRVRDSDLLTAEGVRIALANVPQQRRDALIRLPDSASRRRVGRVIDELEALLAERLAEIEEADHG